MTALLAFLKLSWPYVLCATLAGYLTHRIDSGSYESLEAQYKGYQAQVADADEKAQKAAADALQAQIQTRLTDEARNGQIVSQLTQERNNAAADRDFARRLLAAAQAKSPANRGAVPAPTRGSGSDDPTGSSGDRSLAQDLGDAAGECRIAIQRLAALQAELQPQLRTP